MNSHGITIYLKADLKFLQNRLFDKKNKRPLLIGKNPVELGKFIEETLYQREEFYCRAKFIFDVVKTKNREIIDQLESVEKI